MTQRRFAGPIALLALALLAGRPAPAQVVTLGSDSSTPADGELRKEIQDLNTAGSGSLFIQVANITVSRGSLPSITASNCSIIFSQDTIINCGGSNIFSGSVINVNSSGNYTVIFNDAAAAININSSASSTIRRIVVTGNRTGGIAVNAGSNNVTLQGITFAGNRGGTQIDVTGGSVTMQGICVPDGGAGVNINASVSANFSSLAQNALGGGTWPAFRLHNFIGYLGNDFEGLNGAIPDFSSNYDTDGTGSTIDGVGLNITTTGNVTVTDTDVGNCNSHGIQINPNGGIPNIVLRRIHVGVPPEGFREDNAGGALHRRVVGDGIRILGGRAQVVLGNVNDVNFNYADDDTSGNYNHEHKGGDLGITVGGCRGGAGIRVGIGDDPVNGDITIRYCRSGTDSTGDREVVEGIPDQGAPRRQLIGLATNSTGGYSFSLDNCQFSGNTQYGAFLQSPASGPRFSITNNIIGLNSTSEYALWSSDDVLPLGNGDRSWNEGTTYPASASGTGMYVNIGAECTGFYGNVIAGNAGDGLVFGPLVQGTGTPSNPTASFGDGTADGWNYIGVCGRGVEGGKVAYDNNPNGVTGLKLRDSVNPDAPAETEVSSDLATGDGPLGSGADSDGNRYTPRIRGNGTIIYSGSTPVGVIGNGFKYQGAGSITINGNTISDNAQNGLVIDTPTGNDSASVVLRRTFIGVGGDPAVGVNTIGTVPTDGSIGNGTIGRSPSDWGTIRFARGAGVQIRGNGDHRIGVGSSVNIPGADCLTDRCVISSNLLFGVEIMGTVGVPGQAHGASGNSSIAISNCCIGSDLTGMSAGSATNGGLGFGNGYQPSLPVMGQPPYAQYYGAGVRVEPGVGGRHMIGGDDGGYSVDFSAAGDNESNVISNNGLVGVWLRGVGNVCVVGNYIGTNSAGTARLGPSGVQQYGVLIESNEYLGHIDDTAACGANSVDATDVRPNFNNSSDILTQYVGYLPYGAGGLGALTNENTDPNAGGGPGYYTNVISGNGMWGVSIEDNGDHIVDANLIGTNKTGTAAIPNGADGFTMVFAAYFAPETFQSPAGISIGALYQDTTGLNTIAGNIISGNSGHGIAQYRNGTAKVVSNFIGTNMDGDAAIANTGHGIQIWGSGVNQVKANLLSGNGGDGINIVGTAANVIEGNYIGTNAAGDAAIANAQQGIEVTANASGDNQIGRSGNERNEFTGANWPRRNVISGNATQGVLINGGGNNVLQANYIGLNATGDAAVPNADVGVKIAGVGWNLIGGPTQDSNGLYVEGNKISGNTGDGVLIVAPTAGSSGNNTLRGNTIGLNAAGDAAVPNGGNGVSIGDGTDANRPQGANVLWANTISGNTGHGVFLNAAGQNTLRGNKIGTNLAGDAAVPNGTAGTPRAGVEVIGCTTGQLIGIANTGANTWAAGDPGGNLISGNRNVGIQLDGTQAHLIYGNRIGTNWAGTAGLTNQRVGILAAMTSGSATIGGTLTGQTNVISGNTQYGVNVTGPADYTLRGNWIGLDATGNAAAANGVGLWLQGTGTNTVAENRIGGNTGDGVQIQSGTNTLTLNRIGTNADGDTVVANGGDGIECVAGGTGTQTIGVATQGNVVSGNGGHGVLIEGAGDYTLVSNLIGLDVAGASDLGNTGDGIRITANATGAVTIGGTGGSEGNSISGNGGWGINHLGAQRPVIVANLIGTNAAGSGPVGNGGGVRFASTQVTQRVILGGTYTAGGALDEVAGNLVSGNNGVGVRIEGCTHPVELYGNLIGTNLNGSVAIGQNGHGIQITAANAQDNIIGNLSGGRNVISGNGIDPADPGADRNTLVPRNGIYIQGSGSNQILGNSIGGSAGGAQLAGMGGNTGDGIRIDANTDNRIEGNTIRDNDGNGVGILNGTQEYITNNTFINNGTLFDEAVGGGVVVGHLPIHLDSDGVPSADPRPGRGGAAYRVLLDIKPNDGVTTAGRANLLLDYPELFRLVRGSGDNATLFGQADDAARRLEIYRAADQPHHRGGAEALLRTVNLGPVSGGVRPFQVALTGIQDGDLITAIAFDANNNTSEFAHNIGFVNGTESTIAIAPNNPVADGVQAARVTVTLRDSIGTPLVGINDVRLAFSDSPAKAGLIEPTYPLPATDANGQTFGDVKSTRSGTTTVTATSGGVTINQPEPPATDTNITFLTANIDPAKSTFEVDRTQVRTDGVEQVTFTFTIRNINNQPVEGVLPNELFVTHDAASGVAVVQPSQATDANGQTTATATGTIEQTVTFRGLYGGPNGTQIPSPRQVNFVAAPLDVNASDLTVTPATVAADNSTTATLTVTLINVDGQPMVGVPAADIVFDAGGATGVTFENLSSASDDSGKFFATVRSGTVQSVGIRVTVRGDTLAKTVTVVFTADAPSADQSTMTVTPTTAVADGNSVVGVAVTVKDTQGRVKVGERVTIIVEPTDGVSINQPPTTGNDGTTSGSFTATIPGTYQVRASVGPPPGSLTLGPQQVTMTPNPPDPDRSSASLSSAAIVADGTETSTLTITLIDALGRSLQGVAPGEITVTANPAVGVTVNGPNTATDADGVTTALISGTAAADVTLTVVARGVTIETLTLTLRDFATRAFEIGTHMMGVAATPIDPRPEVVFANLLPGLRLARWQPAAESYLQYVQGTQSTFLDVLPGRGFWLALNRDFNLRVVGDRTPAGAFTLPMEQGWNQLANPYDGDLAFRLNQIQVFRNGALVGTLDTDAARALVDPYAWIWDPVLGYLLVIDPATAGAANVPGTIGAWRAFWMLARQPDVSVRLTGPQPIGGAGRAARSRQVTPREWMLSLQVEANGVVSRSNLLGVSDRRMAVGLPPESPEPSPVLLRFRDEGGRAVAADVRQGPLTRRATWDAVVNAPAGSDVTVSWPGVNRGIPERHRLYLIDKTTGRRTVMNSRAGYTYRQEAGSREFAIEVDPRGQHALTVTQMTVNSGAGRSRSIGIDFTISAPAQVVAVIKGLGGSVVRELRGTADEGNNSLAWDRKDRNGRVVPAGVYVVELTCYTDEGEVVRLTRQVRVN